MTIDAWPTSVWVAAALGPLGAYLLYGFIKESKGRSSLALAVAAAAHVAFMLLIPDAPPKRPKPPQVMEIELLEPHPEPPAPTQPAPTEPEPQPEPKAPKVEPKVEPRPDQPKEAKPPRVRKAKSKAKPAPVKTPEPAGPKRFDLTQLNLPGASGVAVRHGSGGGSTLGGDPRNNGKGKPKGSSPPSGSGSGSDPAGSTGSADRGKAWAPASQVFISQLPMPRSIPKRECPATRDGVQGTVFLKVQVRRDGTVRRVKVVKGIGSGCDAIAVAALKKAKFKAAKNNGNKAVDFEIRYEYAFSLAR